MDLREKIVLPGKGTAKITAVNGRSKAKNLVGCILTKGALVSAEWFRGSSEQFPRNSTIFSFNAAE